MIVFSSLLSILFGCQRPIPLQFQHDSVQNSARFVNAQVIGQWSQKLPRDTTLNFFQVHTLEGNEQYRAFLRTGPKDTDVAYVGELAAIFPDAPVLALLIDIGGERYIAGRIEDLVSGHLETIAFVRLENDRARLNEATKISTIKERMFLIPIAAAETEEWHAIQRIAISTRESLQAMHNDIGTAKAEHRLSILDGTAWSRHYDPAVSISERFINPYE